MSLTLASVMKSDVDVRTLPPDVPATVRTVLHRCLEKDPRQRLRDVGDVRLAMEGAFETRTSTPAEPTAAPKLRVWQRPIPVAVTGLALLVIGALAGRGLTGSAPAPDTVGRFELLLGEEERFVGLGRHAVALSPDGRHIVYTTQFGLSLRSLDEVTPSQLAGTLGAREPFFSPDGQWIGFWADARLQRVSITGGAPVTLCDVSGVFGASWGVDDTILYGQGPEGIWRVSGTGGTPESAIAVEEGEQAHGPQMLPGGEWVLFTLRPAGVNVWDQAQIVVQSLATGERAVLMEGGRDARYVPTGHLVYALNGVLLAVPFDLDARHVLGGPVSLVESVRATEASGAVQFSVAGNGSLVYVPEQVRGNSTLVWVDRDGRQDAISAEPGDYSHVRVSPDGTRIALARDFLIGDSDVWIWHLDQGPLTRLTFLEGLVGYPVWTPDSSRVVFRSTREGGGLFWKAADGSGEVDRLLESTDQPRPMAWAPDGRVIFWQPPGDIGVLTVDGDRTVELLFDREFDEGRPALSPDGRWLAYQSDESGRREIYVRPFPNIDAGKWQVSTDGGTDPVWSPDRQELFFRNGDALMMSRFMTEPSFTHGTPETLFSTSDYRLDEPPIGITTSRPTGNGLSWCGGDKPQARTRSTA